MIAVSDTSPICYLVLIGEVELLPKVFSTVLVPEAVLAELRNRDAPTLVRTWAANPPVWVTPKVASESLAIPKLQEGERQAIQIARDFAADFVLLDERAARKAAKSLGIRATGTLGFLGEAALRGLVDLPNALDRLTQTSFRYTPALLKTVLQGTGTSFE
jgi:predicted nucleic acid-binding protein